ncbi:MAG: DsrH/TusB family sulfur metabolism protein [Pseudomonadota bacterium]
MTLHCLNSDAGSDLIERLLGWLDAGDAVLLLGPAANVARSTHPALAKLLAGDHRLYALDDDLIRYGVSPHDHRVEALGYDAFVELAAAHRKQLLWR